MSAPTPSAPLTARISSFIQSHRQAVILTAAATTAVVSAGVVYYYQANAAAAAAAAAEKKKKRKGRSKKAGNKGSGEEKEKSEEGGDDQGEPAASLFLGERGWHSCVQLRSGARCGWPVRWRVPQRGEGVCLRSSELQSGQSGCSAPSVTVRRDEEDVGIVQGYGRCTGTAS
jgi:hypothetical protein